MWVSQGVIHIKIYAVDNEKIFQHTTKFNN